MKASVHDFFKIHCRYNLNGEDYVSLAQMYLPIMGIDSYALYTVLISLRENEKYTFKKLLDILSLTSMNLLFQSFSKLEALALVKTFHHEQKGYVFQLYPPLSRDAFLENSVLSSFLNAQIGEVEFKRIVAERDYVGIKGYENLTKSFDEVYNVKTDALENIFSRIYKFKNSNQVKVKNPDFDYIFFKMNFDSSFLDPKIFDDEEFKQQILTISFNYQLNEEEMKEVILQTITLDKDLKYTDISKNARIFYQKKNKVTKPRFVTKDSDSFINSETDEDTFLFLQKIENLDPVELLRELNGGMEPAVSELKMIEDLLNNTKFPQSMINIMILLVNHEKEGVLPGYNYFEKIANTWARAGLKTPMDVIGYINREQKSTQKPVVRGKKQANLPDWYDEYEKQLINHPQEEELSQDEIAQILEEAKKKNQ
jgi:replication initiation and membrane attachment protein